MAKIDLTPPLAHYLGLMSYSPRYGDYVVWSGWFATWHGIVVDYKTESDELSIIFAGLPELLLSLTPEEQQNETRTIKLSKIKSMSILGGRWAILQHDYAHNNNVWYI